MKGVPWATDREREVNRRREVCEIVSGRGEQVCAREPVDPSTIDVKVDTQSCDLGEDRV